jgi:hypothetical protein
MRSPALDFFTNSQAGDARGIAQLLRMGWFRPVHAQTAAAQEIRA